MKLSSRLLKGIIFKFSGTRGYLTYKPIFVGMITGQLMGGALWAIIDFTTGEIGNAVFIGVP